MTDALPDMLERPWSAEVSTPLNTKHPKYNLPLVANPTDNRTQALATALASSSQNHLEKSPSTKALKAQWAAGAPKGVDTVRESTLPTEAYVQTSAVFVQVCASTERAACLTRVHAPCAPLTLRPLLVPHRAITRTVTLSLASTSTDAALSYLCVHVCVLVVPCRDECVVASRVWLSVWGRV